MFSIELYDWFEECIIWEHLESLLLVYGF